MKTNTALGSRAESAPAWHPHPQSPQAVADTAHPYTATYAVARYGLTAAMKNTPSPSVVLLLSYYVL